MQYQIRNTDEIFEISPTDISPNVILDKHGAKITIRGTSIMENSRDFYALIIDALKEYFRNTKPEKFEIILYFYYLNSQGIKEILSLFNLLEAQHFPITVSWYYSDEEMGDLGTQLCELVNLKFERYYKEL